MEATKVIIVTPNSLGFEIGDNPKWRGEFTLEQVSQFNIKAGQDLTVHFLEMEDTFATVEFGESERTTVAMTKVSENNDFFTPESPNETDTPNFDDTLRVK